ncbi:MAG: hypothetical protein N3F63_05740 [Thermoplasmata archaeon]|nr:hypothetical protein [Thermoplasmata archaeon]
MKLNRKGRVPFSLIAVIIAFLTILSGIYMAVVTSQRNDAINLQHANSRMRAFLILHEDLLVQAGVSAVLSAVNKSNAIVYTKDNPIEFVENESKNLLRTFTGIGAGGQPMRFPDYSATHKNLQWKLNAFRYDYMMMNESGVVLNFTGDVYFRINGKITTTIVDNRTGYSLTKDINLDSWVSVTLPFLYQQKKILVGDINGTQDYLGFVGNITHYLLKRTFEEIFDYEFSNITKALVREAVECAISFDEARLYQKTANASLHSYLLSLGDRSEVDPFEYWKDLHGWSETKKPGIRHTDPIHLNYTLYDTSFYFSTRTVEFKMNDTERSYAVYHELILPDSAITLNETTKEVHVRGGMLRLDVWEKDVAFFVAHRCLIEVTLQPLLLMG